MLFFYFSFYCSLQFYCGCVSELPTSIGIKNKRNCHFCGLSVGPAYTWGEKFLSASYEILPHSSRNNNQKKRTQTGCRFSAIRAIAPYYSRRCRNHSHAHQYTNSPIDDNDKFPIMVILHGHINACERMCLWSGWLTFAASEHLFLNADRNGFLFIFFDVFVFFFYSHWLVLRIRATQTSITVKQYFYGLWRRTMVRFVRHVRDVVKLIWPSYDANSGCVEVSDVVFCVVGVNARIARSGGDGNLPTNYQLLLPYHALLCSVAQNIPFDT